MRDLNASTHKSILLSETPDRGNRHKISLTKERVFRLQKQCKLGKRTLRSFTCEREVSGTRIEETAP